MSLQSIEPTMKQAALHTFCAIALLLSACADPETPLPLDQAAARAIAEYRTIAHEGNLTLLGLDSSAQADLAGLGTPFTVYYVSIDELKDYADSIDPVAMLIDAHLRMYPVMLGQHGHAFVVLEGDSTGYTTASLGGAATARLFTQRRTMFATQTSIPVDSIFLVRIPALNLDFVGGVNGASVFQLGLAGRGTEFIQAADTVSFDSLGVYSARDAWSDLVPTAQNRGSSSW